MTKEMYDKCRNEKMVAWAGLPQDVKDTILNTTYDHIEVLMDDGVWAPFPPFKDVKATTILRVHERCKPEGYEYIPVEPKEVFGLTRKRWACLFNPPECYSPLFDVLDIVGFDGIEYRKPNGTTTWAMQVDQSIGVPVRVRFKK